MPSKRQWATEMGWAVRVGCLFRDVALIVSHSDGLLARDGILTKMAEGIPGAGCLVGLIHHLNNYPVR